MLQRVARYFSARPLLLLLTADFVFIAVHVCSVRLRRNIAGPQSVRAVRDDFPATQARHTALCPRSRIHIGVVPCVLDPDGAGGNQLGSASV